MPVWGLHGAELSPSLLGTQGSVSNTTSLCGPSPFLGEIVSPCTWRQGSPSLFPPLNLWKSQQRSALFIFWQAHVTTGWTGLKMPGGSCSLIQGCLRGCTSQAMSHLLGWRDFALLGVHPAILPARAAWLHPLWSHHGLVVTQGETGAVDLEKRQEYLEIVLTTSSSPFASLSLLQGAWH